MCIQNGPAGYLKGGDPLVKARLPADQWEKFLKEAAAHGPFVHIWGGEPLLYKEIDELVDAARRLDLVMMMTTNSVRGLEHLDTLSKLDVLRISVDGPEDVHDSVRGRPGTFQAAVDLIRAVAEERRKRRSYWPRIVTNSLLIDQSYPRLLDTARILAGGPIDHCDLSLPMFTTEERGRAYEKILAKEWNAEARAWKGFRIEGLTVDLAELTRLLREVQKNYSRTRFGLFPIGRISGIPDWYNRLEYTFGFSRCHAITDNMNVLPNGDVVLCNDLPDLVIGNVTRQSVEDIWNGEIARSFRERLNKALLPVCSRCCSLYTFPVLKAARQQRWLR
jgi:radical SAM protein with 4Fe4S-binding SPASM domain